MAGPSSKPIPASLRPAQKPQELHIVFVVPDERVHRLLVDKTYILQPPYATAKVIGHVVSEQWAKDKDMLERTGQYRQALLELGLTNAEDMEFKPVTMTLGWE